VYVAIPTFMEFYRNSIEFYNVTDSLQNQLQKSNSILYKMLLKKMPSSLDMRR